MQQLQVLLLAHVEVDALGCEVLEEVLRWVWAAAGYGTGTIMLDVLHAGSPTCYS
jgi:hypothetical protein